MALTPEQAAALTALDQRIRTETGISATWADMTDLERETYSLKQAEGIMSEQDSFSPVQVEQAAKRLNIGWKAAETYGIGEMATDLAEGVKEQAVATVKATTSGLKWAVIGLVGLAAVVYSPALKKLIKP